MEVSIIIPYRIDRGFLEEAIESCQKQVFNKSFEVIVQQGGFRLGKNVNDGVKRSKGKYIKILADDDLLLPNCLQDLYDKAEQGFDFVCADAIDMHPVEGDINHDSFIPHTVGELGNYNSIHGGTILYRAEVMPPWDESMWCGEEYEMSLRMADMGLRFGYVNKIVHRYRMHACSKTSELIDIYGSEKVYRWDYIDQLQDRYRHSTKKINRGY